MKKRITELPQERVCEILNYLDEESQSNLALSAKMFGHGVFQQDRLKAKLVQHILGA